MINRYDAMAPKDNNGKTFWLKIGSAWPSKSGNGFNVILDAMPAPTEGAFRFSLFEPKENSSGSGGNYNSGGGSGKRPSANVPDNAGDDIPF